MPSDPRASVPEKVVATAVVGESVPALARIPPTALVLLAVVAIQLGAGISTQLFPVLGVEGTVAVRILFSAVLLWLVSSLRIKSFGSIFVRNWQLLLAYGLCMAAMNFFFYKAIDRIPLGAAVAIEFSGPLAVAAFSARRASHIAWVALAALGIILLSPLTGASLDAGGIFFALLAGAGWALFILLTRRVADRISGNDGLVIGMAVAAVVMLPYALPVMPELFSSPLILLAGLGVALLSTAIPFTFEFEALKRISTRAYGILVSMEPAVATLVGVVLLGERLGTQGMVAIACVVVAAIGITVSEGQSKV